MLKVKSQPELRYYSKNDTPYGHSYGAWTVKWWQWAFSSPIHMNPIVDTTGEYCAINQYGPVWFLAGTVGENKMPIRRCDIPFGKAILFPVINYEINQLEEPKLRTNDALVRNVVDDINDIVKREATVDGLNIPTFRVQSSPKVFSLNVSNDNWLGIPPGSIKAAADGYWVFLKPLGVGNHEIFFHGSCSAGTRNSTARYFINIVK